jgi:hypothetical protein
LHDSRIVYTVNNHFLDSSFLESFLFLKVSGNLLYGSGRGECTWKTNNNNVLSCAMVSDINLFDVWEALHDFH